MAHDLYERDDDLVHCRVCGGAEGSLPTDCPGRRMTEEEQDAVYAQQLDFKRGKWWWDVEVKAKSFIGAWFFEELAQTKMLRVVEPDGTEHCVNMGDMNSLAGIKLLNAMVRDLTRKSQS